MDDWANESRLLALKYAYPLGSERLSKVTLKRQRDSRSAYGSSRCQVGGFVKPNIENERIKGGLLVRDKSNLF
ncbi:MAG: hypothetical protein CM1200mP16_03000 [Nitrospina sp.]|nr:MAG: hypothetical protein CM1200mP16_03000 [Nitrospina sp.]